MRFQYPLLVTLSSLVVSAPSSIVPNWFPIPHKVFLQSTHWVQSRPQLVIRLLASFPTFSCSTVYETRSCVYLCFLHRLFFFPISSQAFVAFVLSSSRGLSSTFHLPPFYQFLCVPFLLVSSCRAHNCITERLFSQLTLPPSSSPFCYISGHFRLDMYTSNPGQNCIICSYLQQNGTKRTMGIHTRVLTKG